MKANTLKIVEKNFRYQLDLNDSVIYAINIVALVSVLSDIGLSTTAVKSIVTVLDYQTFIWVDLDNTTALSQEVANIPAKKEIV